MSEENRIRFSRGDEDYYYITVNGKYVYSKKKEDNFVVEIGKDLEDSIIILGKEHALKLVKVINTIFDVNIRDIKMYHVVKDKENDIIKNEYQIDITKLI